MNVCVHEYVQRLMCPLAAQQCVRNDLGSVCTVAAPQASVCCGATHFSSHSNILALNSATVELLNHLCVLPSV